MEGRTLTRAEPGRTVPFRPEGGLPGACRETVRLLAPGREEGLRAGARVRVRVRWEARGHPEPERAEWAGRLRVVSPPEPIAGGTLPGRFLAIRGGLQERMAAVWGDRAPMVEALVLARREHLDPELRESFALSGTVHLLAISGFHVGVVAGLVLGLLRLLGTGRRWASAGAALGCWIYVLGIGAPHAAARAALLLTLLAAARIRGRPVVPAGALASAFLLLLLVDPLKLGAVGFQLSFAGTGGLVFLREPLFRLVDAGALRWRGRPLAGRGRRRGPGEGLLRGGADGLVAGAAATLPTLPLLAWHFDRISLVGIPATLVAAPLVTAVIPGIGASLFLSWLPLPPGPDTFLAGAVAVLLVGLEAVARQASELPGASVWVSRRALLAAILTGVGVVAVVRLRYTGRIGAGVRRWVGTATALSAVMILPLLPGPGADALELHVIDVGQGDALALRLPSGRWVVVDAGPRHPRFDAGARRVVPYLRRYGARRVEALILSHPHLDHVGGAAAVLEGFPVGGILDPSRPVPLGAWLDVLRLGRERGISWWPARVGRQASLDGVHFQLLHPDGATVAGEEVTDWNELSIVLLVRFGTGAVLLTGDAGREVEERILEGLPRLSVLKVGHHGSRTSSSASLLDRSRPRVAVIPVGDGNRYGHPHRNVTARYHERSIPLFRTDRDGDLRVRIRRDGTVSIRTGR